MARTLDILMVEDNPGDVHLTLQALREARLDNEVRVVGDGESALRLLGAGRFADRDGVRPDLILLDLNLPRKNGHEVLAAIRETPATRAIPVVILTSSQRDADVARSYRLQANCYVTKPVDVEGFLRAAATIADFWISVARLPVRRDRPDVESAAD